MYMQNCATEHMMYLINTYSSYVAVMHIMLSVLCSTLEEDIGKLKCSLSHKELTSVSSNSTCLPPLPLLKLSLCRPCACMWYVVYDYMAG